MKKKLLLILSFLLFSSFINIYAQKYRDVIENVAYYSEHNNLIITFDIVHQKSIKADFMDSYDILIEVITPNGKVKPESLNGDFLEVIPGSNKEIIWDIFADVNEIDITSIQLVAKYMGKIHLDWSEQQAIIAQEEKERQKRPTNATTIKSKGKIFTGKTLKFPSKKMTKKPSSQAKITIGFANIKKQIKEYVENKINTWQQKDEFESSADYRLRMNERPEKIRALTDLAIQHYKEIEIEKTDLSSFTLSQYDADRETFKITLNRLGSFVLKVPNLGDEARNFKKLKNTVSFTNPDLIVDLNNNKWIISHIEAVCAGTNKNYTYNINNKYKYDPVQDFDLEFKPIVIDADNQLVTEDKLEDAFDPDDIKWKKIKINKSHNKDAFAFLVGNKNYKHLKSVDYSYHDVHTMRNYLINALGFKRGNVIVVKDATQSDFNKYFGVANNHKGEIYNMIKHHKSDVYIFYAGHGAPGLKDGSTYFVPTDCEVNYLENQGYATDVFYNNLSKLPAKSITVVLDACFSGADIYKDISNVKIKIKNSSIKDPKILVFSSSSQDQVSCWYNAKQHGLFTYFFLKSLYKYQQLDSNKDGALTASEMFRFIADKSEGLPYYARRLHKLTQNPKLLGQATDRVILTYEK